MKFYSKLYNTLQRTILCTLACSALHIAVLAPTAQASDEIIRYFRSLRAQAMGGVVHTTGDFSDALFANPARHNQPLEGKFTPIDLTIQANGSMLTSIDDISNVKGSGAAVVSSIAPLIGSNLHSKVGILIAGYSPEFIHEDWGFAAGLLIQPQVNLYPHYDTVIDTQTYIDVGPHIGVAKKFLDGALSVGLNTHYVLRIAADRRVRTLDTIANNQSLSLRTLAGEGFGIDTDLGAFYKLPWEWSWVRLSVGTTLNNLVQSTYQLYTPGLVVKDGGTPPARNNRTVSAGVRADLADVWIFKNNVFAVEAQDMGSLIYRSSVAKRFHLGGETELLKWLHLRMGLNQGYVTGGLGFAFSVIRLDIATWSEELGLTAGQRQDRRFGLRFAVEI